jgi:hypothetical protein
MILAAFGRLVSDRQRCKALVRFWVGKPEGEGRGNGCCARSKRPTPALPIFFVSSMNGCYRNENGEGASMGEAAPIASTPAELARVVGLGGMFCVRTADASSPRLAGRRWLPAPVTNEVATLLTGWWFPEFHLVSIRIYYPGELPVL